MEVQTKILFITWYPPFTKQHRFALAPAFRISFGEPGPPGQTLVDLLMGSMLLR